LLQTWVQVCASGADRSGAPVMVWQCHPEQGKDNGTEIEVAYLGPADNYLVPKTG